MSSSANQLTGTSLAAPATPDLTDDVSAELSGLLNQSYQVSKDISQTSEAYLKQEKINKVNAIGGAASALATAVLAVGVKTAVISNAVPGIGTIIGLCIAWLHWLLCYGATLAKAHSTLPISSTKI